MVVSVGDVDVVLAVYEDARRVAKFGAGGWTTVTAKRAALGSGERADVACGRRDLAGHVVVRVSNVDVAGAVASYAVVLVKFGLGSQTPISGVACGAVSSKEVHQVRRLYEFAHEVIVGVIHEYISGGIAVHSERVVKNHAAGRLSRQKRGQIVGTIAGHGANVAADRKLANPCVVSIGYGDRRAAHRDLINTANLRAGGSTAVSQEPVGMVARDGVNFPGGLSYFADYVVVGVRDIQVAGSVGGNAVGLVDLGCGCSACIACVPAGAIASIGGDDVGGENQLANAAVVGVGDKEIPEGVGGDSAGAIKLRGRALAPIPAVAAGIADAGDGVNRIGRVDLADHAITLVGEVHVSGTIDRDAVGVIQAGVGGGSRDSVSAEALRTGAGEHGERSSRAHFEHAVLVIAGNIEIAGAVGGHGNGVIEIRVDGGNFIGPASDRRRNYILLRQCGQTQHQGGQQKN